MTLFEIVGLYAALNMLLLVFLSFRVIGVRKKDGIGIGDGGNAQLQKRIRAHGNLTEYAPMALIGLLLMAGLSATPIWLHCLGGALTLGRFLHAFGISNSEGVSKPRVFGMILTFTVLTVEAGYLLFHILA
ncbi:MAG: glutathione S-transferase [Robiginitomaculum sp.]|nr:MAG: glutathione S-transferase [Robiginitomaculum sp.]